MAALGDQDFLDQVRMADEENPAVGEAQCGDVAVGASAVRKEFEAMQAEFRQVAAQPVSLRPKWHTKSVGHDAFLPLAG